MYEWLAYSKKGISGGLCKMCIIFEHCGEGTNYVKLGKLVHHASTDYHKGNMIASQLASSRKKKKQKKKLIPIIKRVIFFGAQNILLGGHRDDGDLPTEPEKNMEKFRIDAGDEILASHIGVLRQKCQLHNVVEMPLPKKSLQSSGTEYFTIMADETTDIYIKEQLAICIRYFYTTSYEIQEKFFKFFDVVDVSGENIACTILQELKRLNLDISYCRGQAYGGGSNMSDKFKGVQAHIAKEQTLLNLEISKACSVASIRNAIGSAWRIHKLETEVQDKLPHLKKGKHAFRKMCERRWVEKHDAVLTFFDTLPCLPIDLETISESSESRGSNAVVFLAEVFGLTLALARKLQAEYMDVLEAMKLSNVRKALTHSRKYSKSPKSWQWKWGHKSISQEQLTCRNTDQTSIHKQLKNTIAR
ncbi:hypothetical protein PR048_019418 [Dryococelus australis]|uniref:DUF4371 domain-containing protein n=1 Tax=Dryococelus australis TaxID=614101 RepID=A0ABQ9H3H9_9NEOP|nr:hypothetical protein PR048_019418 [Dryococelus australis]